MRRSRSAWRHRRPAGRYVHHRRDHRPRLCFGVETLWLLWTSSPCLPWAGLSPSRDLAPTRKKVPAARAPADRWVVRLPSFWSVGSPVILLASGHMIRRRSSTRKKRSVGARHYAALGRAPARSGGLWVVVVLGALVVVNLYVFVWDKNTSVPAIQKVAENKTPAMQIPAAPI